ncbi:zinc-binding dehydrogenase [Micromonospora sp. NPDC005163]
MRYGPGLHERIRAAAPEGVDAYVDTYGASNMDVAILLGVHPSRINTIADGRAVQRYQVQHEAQEQANSPAIWSELARLAADGKLVLPIMQAYPLERVREAYHDLATRHVRGKRVLQVMAPERRSQITTGG